MVLPTRYLLTGDGDPCLLCWNDNWYGTYHRIAACLHCTPGSGPLAGSSSGWGCCTPAWSHSCRGARCWRPRWPQPAGWSKAGPCFVSGIKFGAQSYKTHTYHRPISKPQYCFSLVLFTLQSIPLFLHYRRCNPGGAAAVHLIKYVNVCSVVSTYELAAWGYRCEC